MTQQMMTTEELAERWRMAVKSISNWRVQGRGPRWIKLGDGRNGKVLYRLEDIEAFEIEAARRAGEPASDVSRTCVAGSP